MFSSIGCDGEPDLGDNLQENGRQRYTSLRHFTNDVPPSLYNGVPDDTLISSENPKDHKRLARQVLTFT